MDKEKTGEDPKQGITEGIAGRLSKGEFKVVAGDTVESLMDKYKLLAHETVGLTGINEYTRRFDQLSFLNQALGGKGCLSVVDASHVQRTLDEEDSYFVPLYLLSATGNPDLTIDSVEIPFTVISQLVSETEPSGDFHEPNMTQKQLWDKAYKVHLFPKGMKTGDRFLLVKAILDSLGDLDPPDSFKKYSPVEVNNEPYRDQVMAANFNLLTEMTLLMQLTDFDKLCRSEKSRRQTDIANLQKYILRVEKEKRAAEGAFRADESRELDGILNGLLGIVDEPRSRTAEDPVSSTMKVRTLDAETCTEEEYVEVQQRLAKIDDWVNTERDYEKISFPKDPLPVGTQFEGEITSTTVRDRYANPYRQIELTAHDIPATKTVTRKERGKLVTTRLSPVDVRADYKYNGPLTVESGTPSNWNIRPLDKTEGLVDGTYVFIVEKIKEPRADKRTIYRVISRVDAPVESK